MIIQLQPGIAPKQKESIQQKVNSLGYKTTNVITQEGEYLIGIGKSDIDIRELGGLDGVSDIHRVSDGYKLVSRKWKVRPTSINLGDGVKICEGDFAIMSGPCSIESEEQIVSVLQHLKDNGVQIMRGGVYKPRSSPYAFRGLGVEGLKIWYQHAQEFGIKIITEVMQSSQIEDLCKYADILQVGARNSQNFNLLDALGEVDKPVMLKRGISGSLDELLQCAEYVFSGGNEKLLLCERGIRSYETAYRNTFDLNAIPILKEKTHLPVIADPSHGIGLRAYVEPMALAAVMAGADGVIYESHAVPEKAFSDGQQTLNFAESDELIRKIRATVALRKSF